MHILDSDTLAGAIRQIDIMDATFYIFLGFLSLVAGLFCWWVYRFTRL